MSRVNAHDTQPARPPIIVSACLLGLPTRYNGADCRREAVVALAADCVLVPVCPEQLGGLPTPRQPVEIASGTGEDVLDGRSRATARDGSDVTPQLLRGAEAVVETARLLGARQAVLKEGSPSCGVGRIRRGGGNVAGSGVTAALLRRWGVGLEGCD
jgi:uncharacterized protein YbbK (DUF523 family)